MFKLKKLIEQRNNFLDEYEKYFDEESQKYTKKEPKEIDELGDQIREIIKENKETLPVDEIIESLTHLGDAPCILYDDNGKFAVSGEGFAEINTDNDFQCKSLTHVIEEEDWKLSIREAIYHYLDQE